MLVKMREEPIANISCAILILWIFTPLLILLLKVFNVERSDINFVWVTIMQILGLVGLIVGSICLLACFSKLGLEIKNEINLKLNNLGVCSEIDKETSKIVYEKKSVIDILYSFLPLITLFLFFVWCVIGFVFCEHKYFAFFGDPYRNEGILTYAAYGGFILLGVQIGNCKKHIKKVSYCFLISGAIISIASILLDLFEATESRNEYTSVFFNSNHFGYYLLMVLFVNVGVYLFANSLRQKSVCLATYVFLLNVMIINNTFGVYLAFLLTFCGFIVVNGKNKFFLLNDLFVLFSIFILVSIFSIIYTDNVLVNFSSFFNDSSTFSRFLDGKIAKEEIESIGTGRGRLWSAGIDAVLKKPFFGYGLDTGTYVYNKYGIDIDRPHNMLIQMAMFTGIPGCLLYYSTYVVGIVRLFKQARTLPKLIVICAIIVFAYTLSSMFGNSMFYTSPYYLIVLGICMSECLEGINKNIVFSSFC